LACITKDFYPKLPHAAKKSPEKLLLNFGLAKHQIAKRPQYLPPELLLAMGRLGIGLVFAVVDI
jgi:hypothetical protein